MQGIQSRRDDNFVIVLSASVVAGMALALILIFFWRHAPGTMTQGFVYYLALLACPAFFLVRVVSDLTDSTLAMVLTASIIVVANGSLYAGFAAFIYWSVTTRRARLRGTDRTA